MTEPEPHSRDRVLSLLPLPDRKSGTVSAATTRGRRAMLEAIRDRLAEILDGTAGHEVTCACECGMPFDAGKSAGIARELRLTIAELDDLPGETGGSQVDQLAAEREQRRREAQAEGTGEPGPADSPA